MLLGFVQEISNHFLGYFEIRNNTVHKRTDGNDMPRSSAEHLLGIFTNSNHTTGLLVHSNNRRFVQHYSLTAQIDQSIGGTQIDTDIVREKSFKLFEVFYHKLNQNKKISSSTVLMRD